MKIAEELMKSNKNRRSWNKSYSVETRSLVWF